MVSLWYNCKPPLIAITLISDENYGYISCDLALSTVKIVMQES